MIFVSLWNYVQQTQIFQIKIFIFLFYSTICIKQYVRVIKTNSISTPYSAESTITIRDDRLFPIPATHKVHKTRISASFLLSQQHKDYIKVVTQFSSNFYLHEYILKKDVISV